jgi:S1-C subfamily serine protease
MANALGVLRTAAAVVVIAAMAAGAAPAQDAKNNPLQSIVRVYVEVPADARSAQGLGRQRLGSGTVIDDSGLIITIGYVIMEAMSILVTDSAGKPVPAEVVGYDYESGLGLVRAARPLGIKPMAMGDSTKLAAGEAVIVADFRGAEGAIAARVASRREFAGYWEYLLDEALFTSPPHPNWGGAALIGLDGNLYGVGSLLVNDAKGEKQSDPGNMFVPINLLKPIFAELLADGRRNAPPKPWLGLFSAEHQGQVVVTWVSPDSPAAKAGLQPGDFIVSLKGTKIGGVSDFYRKLWGSGNAGIVVPLGVLRDGEMRNIVVESADRYKFMRWHKSY